MKRRVRISEWTATRGGRRGGLGGGGKRVESGVWSFDGGAFRLLQAIRNTVF